MLPEALTPLEWLVGDWEGDGRGEYPTVDDFTYREETSFAAVGKPYLVYTQRTWLADGSPSHMESGFLRPGAPGAPELVIAQPGGTVEVLIGSLTGARVDFTATNVLRTPTAKDVTEIRRVFEQRGDDLWYSLEMAAMGEPVTFHCEATLHRISTES
jgi:hypothetical protein